MSTTNLIDYYTFDEHKRLIGNNHLDFKNFSLLFHCVVTYLWHCSFNDKLLSKIRSLNIKDHGDLETTPTFANFFVT